MAKEENSQDIIFRPAIPLVTCLVLGIEFGQRHCKTNLGITLSFLFLILFLGALAYCLFLKKQSLVLPLFIFFILGFISISPWFVRDISDNHVARYIGKGKIIVTGVVETSPVKNHFLRKFILKVEKVGYGGYSRVGCGRVKVTVSGFGRLISMGDEIRFAARIRAIHNFRNPGGFDYRRYMGFKGIIVSASSPAKKVEILLHGQKRTGIKWTVENIRSRIKTIIDKNVSSEEKYIFTALVTGDKNGISTENLECFNRAGVGHLLAISGLHIGIVAGFSFFLFSWFLSRFEFFLDHGWVRKGGAVLAAFPVLAYGAIAGFSPSTQRAVIMVSVFLIAFFTGKKSDGINTLAIAALVILAIYPQSLFSISFQLSFITVLAILYGLKQYKLQFTAKGMGKVVNRIYLFSFSSFFAILASLPLSAYYFNQISLVGFVTNFVAVPVIGFLVVPLGLSSISIYPIWRGLSILGIQASCRLLKQAMVFISYMAGLPFSSIKIFTPGIFEICCYYLILWALFNLWAAWKKEKKDLTAGKIHRFVLVVSIICLFLDCCFWIHDRYMHKDLRITMLDVGQGNGTFLNLPGGFCMMVDGGGFSDNAVFDLGKVVTAPYLWRNKIQTIEVLVLTHANSDHYNGLAFLADNFHVKEFWYNGDACKSKGFKKLMEIVKKRKIYVQDYSSLPKTRFINKVRFDILYPPLNFSSREEQWRNANNNSLVLKVTLGSKSFLFPGDITAPAERDLTYLASGRLKSTVLLSPHHGSKTSSSPGFLAAVDPETVVISCGHDNRFGFPDHEVIKRYRKTGVKIYRTDQNGALVIKTNGRDLEYYPYEGNPWFVAADNK